MKRLLLALPLLLLCASAYGQCTTGLDPTTIQTSINAVSSGGTVTIGAGTCTWTSGVTVPSTKVVNIVGAGSGRIIAYDNGTDVHAVATGALTVHIVGYSPGFSAGSITNGDTLRVFQNNYRDNWMQGTVTSLIGGALVMNITSINGTAASNGKRWLVATIPSTIIINNSSTTLFAIAEATAGHSSLSGLKFSVGANHSCCTSSHIGLGYTPGGQAVLIHDDWFEHGTGAVYALETDTTTRGVVWNVSADSSTYTNSQLSTTGFYRIKIGNPQAGQDAWTLPAFWGMLDVSGQNNLYVETSDFHAMQALSDIDDNGRTVFRYNLVDHAIFATHGNDTSPYGYRNFEYYNNYGNFNCYGDQTTFNMGNGWIGLIRGGSFVVHDSTLPALQPCTDYSKPDIEPAVLSLRQGANQPGNSCWGAGTSPGSLYYYPRQVGMGRVTGTGHDGKNRTTDGVTYVGDPEPAYIWSNNRTFTVAPQNAQATSQCTALGTLDTATNYVVVNRDYFFSAKPSYTPYTYPHPLAAGGTPAPLISFNPKPIAFGNQNVGTSSNISVAVTNSGNANQVMSATATVSGTDLSLFSTTCNSGLTILPAGSCTAVVKCAPTANASRTGTLNIAGTVTTTDPISCTGTNAVSIPAVPTGLTATAVGTSVNLSWTASTGTPAGYNISRGTVNGGPYTPLVTLGQVTSYVNTGLSNGTYYYVINAFNSAGTSANTSQASATVSVTCGLNLNPPSINFGTVSQGTTTTPSLPVTISNIGTASCTSVAVADPSGPNGADFSQTNNCPSTLAVNASCTILAAFTPSLTALEQASIVVTSSDPGSPDTVSLTGTGAPPVLISPASLSMGNVYTTKTSATAVVNYTNQGSTTITISSVVLSTGDAVMFSTSNDCGGSVLSGVTCHINITFTPTSNGSKTTNLVITDNASGSPRTIVVTGQAKGHHVLKVGVAI